MTLDQERLTCGPKAILVVGAPLLQLFEAPQI